MYAKNDIDNRAGSFIFSGITRPTTIAGSELHAIFVCRTMFKKYLLRSQLQTKRQTMISDFNTFKGTC